MNQILFEDLLNKYLLEKITKEENARFFKMLEEPEYEEILKQHIGKDFLENTYDEREDLVRRERIKQKLAALTRKDKKAKVFTIRRMAAAAAVIVVLAVSAILTLSKHESKTETVKVVSKDIAAPVTNKATITLANGKQIILDSANNGTLAKEGDVNITKLADGQIAYNGTSSEVQYNTLSNPRGSKVVNIMLSDGSRVWLNAESTLKYPTAFAGSDRKVEITGEAYFEVKHDAKQPFTVLANGTEIHDIGTSFNVNAYKDEDKLKVTLVEGSIKVSDKVLKPGQQAQIDQKEIKVVPADIEEATAWKNGTFQFEGADIKTVMRQVARWYDVEVVFEGTIPSKHYNGETSRSLSASQMLKILEDSGIKFRIEGKKIIVTD